MQTAQYLESQLELNEGTFYKEPDKGLWGVGSTVIPTVANITIGHQSIASQQINFVGEASLTLGTEDIPLVDTGLSNIGGKVRSMIVGAEWNEAELATYKLAQQSNTFSGDDLVTTKLEAINVAINRKLHKLATFGEVNTDFFGFLNSPTIPTLDRSTEQILQLTTVQLYDWFKEIISSFRSTSQLTYQDITIYVSDEVLTKLTNTFPNNSNDTPYMALTNPQRGNYVAAINPLSELDSETLESHGTVSTDQGLIVMGNFSPSVIKKHVAPLNRSAVYTRLGFMYGITAWAAASNPIVKQPEKIQYVLHGAATA